MSRKRFDEIYSGYVLFTGGNHAPATFKLNHATTRVSVATDGTQSNNFSTQPSISADGRYIAFSSYADNLVVNDNNSRRDVFVRDRLLNTTTLVSISSTGLQGNASSKSPSISADGRYVAFMSFATNPVLNDTTIDRDVFVRDLLLNTTTLVSVSDTGFLGTGHDPSISSDGRYVAFVSECNYTV